MRRTGAALALLLLLLPSLACAPEPERRQPPPEIETEEIGPAPDAAIDLEADEVGPRIVEGGGVLPGDFPVGLPLPQPYNVIDFGDTPAGGRYAEVAVKGSVAAVLAELEGRAAASGWSVERGVGGALGARRGGVDVRLVVDDSGPGTTVRVEW